jgi:Flp pilus assembly protein TadB
MDKDKDTSADSSVSRAVNWWIAAALMVLVALIVMFIIAAMTRRSPRRSTRRSAQMVNFPDFMDSLYQKSKN